MNKDKIARAMALLLQKQKMNVINSNHIFADNTERDTYFSFHPSEKENGLIIQIIGYGFQSWNGVDWIPEIGVVKGDKGDTGNDGINGTNGANGVGVPNGGTAGQILVKASNTNFDTQWVNATTGGSDFVTYTNVSTVPTTIGGIASGTTFSTPKTMQEMFDALLYPYQTPAFSLFNITGLTNPLEVGDTITANPTFTWATTNSSNINTNTISITDVTGGNMVLVNNIANDGTKSVTLASIQKTTATSHQFKIAATSTQNTTFNKTLTVNWQWKRFYGENTNTSLTETDIKALRINGLSTGFVGTYSFNGGGYKYICYPSNFGTATTFKDQSTNLTVPFDSVTTVSVTNGYGITTTYNVHKSANIMGSAITVIVS